MTNKNKPEKKKNIFVKHLQLMFSIYVIVIVVALTSCFLLPKYYKATVSILKPIEKESPQSLPLTNVETDETKEDTELFVSILKSFRIKKEIVEKFNLVEDYKARSFQEAVDILDKRTTLDIRADNIIRLDFMDTDPDRAANIANDYLNNLNLIILETSNVSVFAVEHRWIEKKLEEIKSKMATFDIQVSNLQSQHNIVVDKDLLQLSQLTGKFSEELYLKNLELEKMAKTEENSEKIKVLRKEVDRIKKTFSKLIEVKEELVVINRELAIQEKLYEEFSSRLEEVKRTEISKIPVVQALDVAGVPMKVNKPDCRLVLVIITVIWGIMTFVIFFFDLLKYLGSI